MRFPEAVDYLLAYHGRSRDSPDRNQPIPRPKPPPPRVKPPFVLPPANPDQRRVFAYLRKRGIAPKVIRAFIDAGLLYEDAQYHNCVFVGRDGSGQPRFASKRGTCDLGGSSFKRDVLGSDKKIGFRLPCDPEIEEVAVFEAPIDLMSFCTLSLGTLKIPAIGLNVKIVQGTDSAALKKGVGHFEETSIWNGNVGLAAHNRGTNSYFGKIHTLEAGDEITLTTREGTRTYEVTSVAKVTETDRSSLENTSNNCLTLYTCVRDERDLRWCVRAVESTD